MLVIVIIVVAMQAPDQNEVVLEEEIMHLQSDQTAQIECIAFESS